MKALSKAAVMTGGALGLVTATAVVARRWPQPSLQQQAAEIRERYRREAAALEDGVHYGRSFPKMAVYAKAANELNDLRVRYLDGLDVGWHELSALDKFRISVEFGMADPESVRVHKEPGSLQLTKTNEGRVRKQVMRMLNKEEVASHAK